jgi:hypothetical protein
MAVWLETINVKDEWEHFQERGYEKTVSLIVAKIKNSRWRDITASQIRLDDLIEELEESLNLPEFNSIWNELYDLADLDRVWIATH